MRKMVYEEDGSWGRWFMRKMVYEETPQQVLWGTLVSVKACFGGWMVWLHAKSKCTSTTPRSPTTFTFHQCQHKVQFTRRYISPEGTFHQKVHFIRRYISPEGTFHWNVLVQQTYATPRTLACCNRCHNAPGHCKDISGLLHWDVVKVGETPKSCHIVTEITFSWDACCNRSELALGCCKVCMASNILLNLDVIMLC